MTIIEALETGLPFRRIPNVKKHGDLSFSTDNRWICYDEEKNGGWFYSVLDPEFSNPNHIEEIGTSLDLYKAELVATDWEVFIK